MDCHDDSPAVNLEYSPGSEPPSPKRQKSEIAGKEEQLPRFTEEEEERMIAEQIRKSEGFDVDFPKFRARPSFFPVELDDNFFVEEPETDVDLLNRLTREALDRYNQEKGTYLKFSKVVKANWHGCAGVMFFITFEVIDPSSSDGRSPSQKKGNSQNVFGIGLVFFDSVPKSIKK